MISLRRIFWTASSPLPDEAELEPDLGALFPAGTRVLMITAFGVAVDRLGAAVEDALRARATFDKVVCVVDQPDFLPLRRLGVAFEYLPPRGPGSVEPAAFADYLRERWAILLSKWRPKELVHVGAEPETILEG